MYFKVFTFIFIAIFFHRVFSDEIPAVVHPEAYSFAFTAGRYPGNVDRTRAEYGDDEGTVRGLYTYVDPRQEIRAVEYTADKNGFHPIMNIPGSVDTPAVASEKLRHLQLFNQIAKRRQNYIPVDTKSVAQAKANHASLYDYIARQHAEIAQLHQQLNATNNQIYY